MPRAGVVLELLTQSTMACQGFSFLLQSCLLLLLVCPLNPSSKPERDMGTLGLLPEELDDMDLEPAPWLDLALVSWTVCLAVLLMAGLVLGRCLGRKLWRWWREVREGAQAGRTGQPHGRGG